jgi:hypothetical protein
MLTLKPYQQCSMQELEAYSQFARRSDKGDNYVYGITRKAYRAAPDSISRLLVTLSYACMTPWPSLET